MKVQGPLVPVAIILLIAFSSCATEDGLYYDRFEGYKYGAQTLFSSFTPGSEPIAVYPFMEAGAEDDSVPQPFGRTMADAFAIQLIQTVPGITLVERSALEDVLTERGFVVQGLLTQEKMDRLGEFVAARYLLSGTYTVGEYELNVQLRLIDTQNGTIVSGAVFTLFLTDEMLIELGMEPMDQWEEEGDWEVDEWEEGEDNDLSASEEGTLSSEAVLNLADAIDAESFDEDRLAVLRLGIADNELTVEQLIFLLETFSFDESIVEAIEYFKPQIVDPENGYLFLDLVSFQDSKEDIEDILSP